MPFSRSIQSLHFGLTSKCTLQCPECVRTMSDPTANTLWRGIKEQRQIDWEQYCDVVKDLTFDEILFCGNWGDPIYYPDLIEFITYIKTFTDTPIVIHTNGSYKDAEFWFNLGAVLKQDDRIVFSIDGLITDDRYRVNNDEESRRMGIQILKNMTNYDRPVLEQKCLLFNYNENRIWQIVTESRNLGFDMISLQMPITDDNPQLAPAYNGDTFEVFFTNRVGPTQ